MMSGSPDSEERVSYQPKKKNKASQDTQNLFMKNKNGLCDTSLVRILRTGQSASVSATALITELNLCLTPLLGVGKQESN
jgi:hypothetical protein